VPDIVPDFIALGQTMYEKKRYNFFTKVNGMSPHALRACGDNNAMRNHIYEY